MLEIQFIPRSEFVSLGTTPPQPAKKHIPQWFKDIPGHNHKNPEFNNLGGITNLNLKSCIPFFDALTSGYILTTWCDLYIKRYGEEVEYFYSGQPELLSTREKSSLPVNNSYDNLEFVWKKHWGVKLPKGFSLLVTHPFNRYDLPFMTCTGIMDTDSSDLVAKDGANVPFYLHKSFEGLIPAGTPIMQFVPIKRESWESNVNEFDLKSSIKKNAEFGRKFKNYYKDNYWNRKEYN